MPRKKCEYVEPKTEIAFHKDVRFNTNLTYGARILLAEIQSMTVDGKCIYSLMRFKNLFGVTYTTLKNWIKSLVKLNLIEIGVDFENPDGSQYFLIKQKK